MKTLLDSHIMRKHITLLSSKFCKFVHKTLMKFSKHLTIHWRKKANISVYYRHCQGILTSHENLEKSNQFSENKLKWHKLRWLILYRSKWRDFERKSSFKSKFISTQFVTTMYRHMNYMINTFCQLLEALNYLYIWFNIRQRNCC